MDKSLSYYITLLRKNFTCFCNERLAQTGLSLGLLFFILYIGKHPECSPKELANALKMDSGHVTRSLVKLEQGGFIGQLCDETDRRKKILQLSESGKNAFKLSHELFASWDKAVSQSLTDSEQAQLFYLLGKLAPAERSDFHVQHNIQPL